MANTSSAKKAIRQSERKKTHNLFWKRRIRNVSKSLTTKLSEKTPSADIITQEVTLLYKVVDKAAKKGVIHKNKANRIKSKFAKNISAYVKQNKKSTKKGSTASSTAGAKKAKATTAQKKSKKPTASKSKSTKK